MTDSPIQIVCSSCSAKNRLPKVKLNDKPLCGKCGKLVLSTSPIVGSDKNFSRYVTHNDLPVVVDFWAPWCGPCKQFAPTFEQVAGGHTIRSIPTLMIFHHGKEIARMSGALAKPQFKQWLAQNLPSI